MRERDAFGLAFRAGSEKQNGRLARVGIRFESAHPRPPRKRQRAQFVARRKHAARVFEREQANACAFKLRLRRFEPRGLQNRRELQTTRIPAVRQAESKCVSPAVKLSITGVLPASDTAKNETTPAIEVGSKTPMLSPSLLRATAAKAAAARNKPRADISRSPSAKMILPKPFSRAAATSACGKVCAESAAANAVFSISSASARGEFRAPVFRLAGGERGAKRRAERDRNRREQSLAAERAEARVFAAADVGGDDRRATAFFPHRRRAVVKFHQNPGATNPPFGKNRHFAAAPQFFAQRAQRERIVRRQRDHPPHRQKRAHPPFAKISRIEREQRFRRQATSEQRAVQQRDMIGDDKTRPGGQVVKTARAQAEHPPREPNRSASQHFLFEGDFKRKRAAPKTTPPR